MTRILCLLLLFGTLSGCTGQPSTGPGEADHWTATYLVGGYGLLSMSGIPEQAGHAVYIALEGHPGFEQVLHLDAALRLLRYDEPCSLDQDGRCVRASYDATLAGSPPAFGVFLLALPPRVEFPLTNNAGVVSVGSPFASQLGGTLGPSQFVFGDAAPIPQTFDILIGNEAIHGELRRVDGDFPEPSLPLDSPTSLGTLVRSIFPGSDADFLGLGASPDQVFAALLNQQLQASQEWQEGTCLRELEIFLQPVADVVPLQGLASTYRAKATLESPSGSATTWDFQFLPNAEATLLVSAATTAAHPARTCDSRKAPANDNAVDFWARSTPKEQRGTPVSFAVVTGPVQVGGQDRGSGVLHYRTDYQPPGTSFGNIPNSFVERVQDARLLFLETGTSELAPPVGSPT